MNQATGSILIGRVLALAEDDLSSSLAITQPLCKVDLGLPWPPEACHGACLILTGTSNFTLFSFVYTCNELCVQLFSFPYVLFVLIIFIKCYVLTHLKIATCVFCVLLYNFSNNLLFYFAKVLATTNWE